MKIKNKLLSVILITIFIVFVGYALLNLAFLLNYGCSIFVGFVLGIRPMSNALAIILTELIFIAIIFLAAYYIFRSKWPTYLKATYLVVPLAVIYIFWAILFYRWPIISYSINGLLGLGGLYFLYRKHQPWEYWFSWIALSLTLLIFNLLGGEI